MKDVLKKILKTATQILKLGDSKTIAASENFIGTGYFAVKKGLIKTLDTVFTKRAADIKNLNYEKLVPSVINNDYQLVENIEVRQNYTQLISKSVTSYLNTSYYIFFNTHIKDLQLYVKNAVDPIIMTNKNNEVLGILLPIRVTSNIVLRGSGVINSDIVDIDNTHIYINVESLDYEEKYKLQDMGFKRFSEDRYIKVFSHDIIRKLGFNLNHEFFENDVTLEELKEELRKKEIKKEIEQKIINESYEKLLPFYQKIINNLINDGYEIKELSIKLSPKKTCYYFYINTDKKEFNLGFICNKGNLDLNKRQQKSLFKMLNNNLVLENTETEKAKEYKNNNEILKENYYISTNPGDKQLVIIQGNNAIINHLQGKTIWKIQEKDIIKDLGHLNIKDYIKHLKKFNFIEIQDITEYKTVKSGEISEIDMNLQLLATKKEVKQSRVNKALERYNLAIKRAEHFYNKIDNKIEEYKNNNEHLHQYYINLKETYKDDLIKAIDDRMKFINKLDNYNIVQDAEIHEDLQYNLKPIYNDDIEGHKEYQIEQLELYNSNTLNFQKKRINHKMIEQYTKYFIYDNKRFMAVKPSNDGIYPSSYYTHVKQYNSLVDVDNKIILFLDDVSLEGVQNA